MKRSLLVGLAVSVLTLGLPACQSEGTVPDCPELAEDHSEEEFEQWRKKAVEAGCWTPSGGTDTKTEGMGGNDTQPGTGGSGGRNTTPGGETGGTTASGGLGGTAGAAGSAGQ